MPRTRRKYPRHRRRRAKKITLQPLTPEAHAEALHRSRIAASLARELHAEWAAETAEYRRRCIAIGEAKAAERRCLPPKCAAEITRRNPTQHR